MEDEFKDSGLSWADNHEADQEATGDDGPSDYFNEDWLLEEWKLEQSDLGLWPPVPESVIKFLEIQAADFYGDTKFDDFDSRHVSRRTTLLKLFQRTKAELEQRRREQCTTKPK